MKFHGNRQQKLPMWREDTGLFCITNANILRSGLRIGEKVEIVDGSSIPFNSDIHSEFDMLYANILYKMYANLQYDFINFYQKYKLVRKDKFG